MNPSNNHLWRAVLLCTLVAGTLDITAAEIAYGPVFGKLTFSQLLQSVARGALGKDAYTGGPATAWLGLLFHYLIAFIWSLVYASFLYPRIRACSRYPAVTGMIYGLLIWSVMNLAVLPLSKVGTFPKFQLKGTLIGMSFIVFLVGFPIAMITNAVLRSPFPGSRNNRRPAS